MNIPGILIVIVGSVFVSLAWFLLIRSIVLWYWKIDVIVKSLESQIALQAQQLACLEKLSGYYGPPVTTESSEELARKAKLYDERQQISGSGI